MTLLGMFVALLTVIYSGGYGILNGQETYLPSSTRTTMGSFELPYSIGYEQVAMIPNTTY